jgi:hypothetical protein
LEKGRAGAWAMGGLEACLIEKQWFVEVVLSSKGGEIQPLLSQTKRMLWNIQVERLFPSPIRI